MARIPSLTRLELQIMEALWAGGPLSIREIQQSFPAAKRSAYTTVQTMVCRLEGKKVVHRLKKISNVHIFEALLSRQPAQRRLIDDFLALFGGKAQPVMAQLIETGKLSLKDIEEAESTLRRLAKRGSSHDQCAARQFLSADPASVRAPDAQSGKPAKRRDEASCSASAGFLNGSLLIKFVIENVCFMLRHSAVLSAACSL